MKTIVYIPFYNADMTEGRGPMVPWKFGFLSKHEGNKYIDQQSGVMGRKVKWSEQKFGDWELKPFVLFNTCEEAKENTDEERRKKALAKLDEDEKKLLGLI